MLSNDVQLLKEKYPSYIDEVNKKFRPNFILIILDSSFYTFSLAMMSVDTIMPYFVSCLTTNSILVGLISAIYSFGSYFPQLFGAHLASRTKNRKWLVFKISLAERFGILMIALIAQFMGFFDRNFLLFLFFLAFALFAITNGLISPVYQDFISKTIIRNRGLFFSLSSALGGIIGFFASLLAHHYLDYLDFPNNFQTLFWFGFGFSFVSPIFISLFKETPFPIEKKEERIDQFLLNAPKEIKKKPLFIRYLFARSIISMGIMANSFYAIYAVNTFDLGVSKLALFSMIALVSQSVTGFFWGWVGDHFGYKKVMLGEISIMIIQTGLAIISQNVIFFYLIAFCMGMYSSASSICDPNIIYEVAPPHQTSLFVGVASTFLAPFYAISPLIGGFLIKNFSYKTAFVAAFFACIVALFFFRLLDERPS